MTSKLSGFSMLGGRVLVTPTILRSLAAPRFASLLRQQGLEVVFPQVGDRPLSEADLLEQLPGHVAVLAGMEPYTSAVLARAVPPLRVIARVGVGYDAVDIEAATAHGVAVTIAPGQNHDSVAEHAFGLMLAVLRKIAVHDRGMRQGLWLRELTRPVRGLTLGLVGLGRIGRAMVPRARAFGMRVVAHDVQPDLAWAEANGVQIVSLSDLLRQADVISLHAPLTPATRHLINAESLRWVKPTAVLINTARGGLVDETALLEALRAGRLAAAGLDVFAVEPLPANHPFTHMEQVVLTPHTAGTDEQAAANMAALAAESVVTLLGGGWPEAQIVNPAVRSSWQH
jgi:phosphoglycerate dehydrogenase-like enzyme